MAASLLSVHYLGHSSFVLRFAGGITVLTDHGQSNAFGLTSPIHDLGGLEPDVVLYSHHDPDHDRGEEFPGATILDGSHLREEVGIDDVVFEPFRTSERSLGDNTSFLIEFEGLRVLFAGDCQGDIVSISERSGRARAEALFPKKADLLLTPVDWTHPIAADAAAFVQLLHPRFAVPMHYWSDQAKADFLSQLRDGDCLVEECHCPEYSLDAVRDHDAPITVVSLEPGPWPASSGEPS
jgi:L-ascorbate metabolism protein UlaG (beta-lactamase superfamily)